jgi:glucose dehydrogenase
MVMRRVGLLLALPSLLAAQSASSWPLHGHDLGGQRFSPLRDVDTVTVARLAPAGAWRSGVKATFQATPIVIDTVMYVSLPFSSVAALDARSGREIWRYSHQARPGKLCCGPANRGVAVSGGTAFVGIAGVGYGLHPDQGLAVVGVAGQYGRPGLMTAFDAASGKRLWEVHVTQAGTVVMAVRGGGERTPCYLRRERAAVHRRGGGWQCPVRVHPGR